MRRGKVVIKWFFISGGRTADEIVNWLVKKTGPPAKDLTSVEDATTFVDSANVVVVGFFKVTYTLIKYLIITKF